MTMLMNRRSLLLAGLSAALVAATDPTANAVTTPASYCHMAIRGLPFSIYWDMLADLDKTLRFSAAMWCLDCTGLCSDGDRRKDIAQVTIQQSAPRQAIDAVAHWMSSHGHAGMIVWLDNDDHRRCPKVMLSASAGDLWEAVAHSDTNVRWVGSLGYVDSQ